MSKIESVTAAVNRRSMLFGAAGLGICAATPGVAASPAVLRGKGKFRVLSLINNRTAERLNAAYWIDGDYIPEALDAFNFILRDWREGSVMRIDPETLDIMSATHKLLGTSEPFEIVSGYRSPRTNAMLRRRSRGVARNSYHTRGMAVDMALKSRSVQEIARAALSLNAGGVGRYSRSSFVHVDSGPVRTWGR